MERLLTDKDLAAYADEQIHSMDENTVDDSELDTNLEANSFKNKSKRKRPIKGTLTAVTLEKSKRQKRVLKASATAVVHSSDESRKTPRQRAEIKRIQALKGISASPQRAIGLSGFDFSIGGTAEGPTLSVPIVDSPGISVGAHRSLKTLLEKLGADERVLETQPRRVESYSDLDDLDTVHEEVLQIFKDGQNRITLGLHHLEKVFDPGIPLKPHQMSEDSYSEESHP